MPTAEHNAWQTLSAEDRKAVLLMTPILRLADNLDRSHGQRIDSVEARLRDGQVTLQIRSRGNIDLEQWGAERTGATFRDVYNRSITVSKVRD
jgi:exopolyphosphatase/guanosine-5'-triphosphate,3'-diphosphate pyrophosphatase